MFGEILSQEHQGTEGRSFVAPGGFFGQRHSDVEGTVVLCLAVTRDVDARGEAGHYFFDIFCAVRIPNVGLKLFGIDAGMCGGAQGSKDCVGCAKVDDVTVSDSAKDWFIDD